MIGRLARWGRIARVRARRWGVALAGLGAAAVVVPPGVVAAGGSADAAFRTAANLVLWGGWIVPLLLASGGCGTQLRSGTALLWLQKPVHGAAIYLDRFVPRLGVTVLAVLVLTALGMLQAELFGPPDSAAGVRQLGLTMAVMAALLACMTYGFSGLGLPHEALVTLLGFGVAAAATLAVAESPAGLGGTLPLVRAVAFPLDEVGFAGTWLAGRSVDDPGRHLLTVALYGAGWVAVGTVGAAFSTRSPRPGGGD